MELNSLINKFILQKNIRFWFKEYKNKLHNSEHNNIIKNNIITWLDDNKISQKENDLEIINIFPTNIGITYWHYHYTQCNKLVDRCLEILEDFKKNNEFKEKLYEKTNFLTEFPWYTFFDVVKDPIFKKLNDWIISQVRKYAIKNGMCYKKNGEDYVPKIERGWFSNYTLNDFQEYHTHPCTIACNYYLKTDIDDCRTVFKSNIKEDNYDIMYKSLYNPISAIGFKPEEGKLIIFRGFSEHSVEQKLNDKVRITLSYNFR